MDRDLRQAERHRDTDDRARAAYLQQRRRAERPRRFGRITTSSPAVVALCEGLEACRGAGGLLVRDEGGVAPELLGRWLAGSDAPFVHAAPPQRGGRLEGRDLWGERSERLAGVRSPGQAARARGGWWVLEGVDQLDRELQGELAERFGSLGVQLLATYTGSHDAMDAGLRRRLLEVAPGIPPVSARADDLALWEDDLWEREFGVGPEASSVREVLERAVDAWGWPKELGLLRHMAGWLQANAKLGFPVRIPPELSWETRTI